MDKKISEKAVNRMTLYHCILIDFITKNIETISSKQMASLIGVDDSQVRKDISFLNNPGKCHVGYMVKELKSAIEIALGFTKPKKAFIIGAGNLGMALAKYENLPHYGLNILALFDSDKAKIGTQVNGKTIYSIKDFPKLAKDLNVDMAILTVPRAFAQKSADMLVKSGIKFIWNFSPTVLSVPEEVQVRNENLMGNFLQFAYKMQD